MLADDGNGRRVSIPVLFISTQTYDILNAIKGPIDITTNFPIPKSPKAKITFFLSSSQRQIYLFLSKLHKDYPHLSSHITIDAVYYTFSSVFLPA